MRHLLLTLLLLGCSCPLLAASGVKGGTTWRDQNIGGVTVRAYRSIRDITTDKAVAVAAPSAADGSYQLDLPPGNYFLTARDYVGQPQPDKHFCYFSGAPVSVRDGAYSNVGFNLVRIPREAPSAAAPSSAPSAALRGEISYQGAPLERAYLYVYKDPGDAFKGPGYLVQPVAKGNFKLRLPPGEYWLLVRKRAKGGQFGPVEIGDYFGYYYGNPVRIAAGQEREVKIEAIARLAKFEEGAVALSRGVRGRVTGPGGKPAAGLYVFAYRDAAMSGTPAFFSKPTSADGSFQLPLGEDGTFYLLARQEFGGPAGAGELYGRLDGAPLRLDAAHPVREVVIHVEPKRAP